MNKAMKLVDPAINAWSTPVDCCLTLGGLNESHLSARSSEIFTHIRLTMPIYIFSTPAAKAERWMKGIVKSGSFSIEQGVGVRAH